MLVHDSLRCQSRRAPTIVVAFDRRRYEQRNRNLNRAEQMVDEPRRRQRAGVRVNRLDVDAKVRVDVRRQSVVDHHLLHIQLLHARHNQNDSQTTNRRPVHEHVHDDERDAVLLNVATDLRAVEEAIHHRKRSACRHLGHWRCRRCIDRSGSSSLFLLVSLINTQRRVEHNERQNRRSNKYTFSFDLSEGDDEEGFDDVECDE